VSVDPANGDLDFGGLSRIETIALIVGPAVEIGNQWADFEAVEAVVAAFPKQGDRLEFRLAANSLGFPVTAVLQLEDETGKQLVREDMSVTLQDPKIAWTAKEAGKYVLELQHRGHRKTE